MRNVFVYGALIKWWKTHVMLYLVLLIGLGFATDAVMWIVSSSVYLARSLSDLW